MCIVFVVNDINGMDAGQTTTSLARHALQFVGEVAVMGIEDLSIRADRQIVGQAVMMNSAHDDARSFLQHLRAGARVEFALLDARMVWIRTNPARDKPRATLHQTALSMLGMLKRQGAYVVNDPDGLQRAQSKMYLTQFPDDVVPPTCISRDPDELHAFIDAMNGPVVLKPLHGTHGRDVFFVDRQERKNLNQIIDVLTRHDWAIAQRYLPDAVYGDVRVLLVHGQCLTLNGETALVRRVPGERDFRSNIHAGGTATRAPMSLEIERVVAHVGARLQADGIAFAGLDLIGSHLVEINVFSAGGLVDADRFYSRAFTAEVVRRMLHDRHLP